MIPHRPKEGFLNSRFHSYKEANQGKGLDNKFQSTLSNDFNMDQLQLMMHTHPGNFG